MYNTHDTGFGPHLIVDCFGCSAEKLSNVDFVLELLAEIPGKIESKTVLEPHVFDYNVGMAKEHGLSGVVRLSDAHISIHTFPEQHYALVDIFSAKDFNADKVKNEILVLLGATDHEVRLLSRGVASCQSAS